MKGSLDVRPILHTSFDTGTHEALLAASLYQRAAVVEKFHPIMNEAIQEFNVEFKKLVSLVEGIDLFVFIRGLEIRPKKKRHKR